MKNKLLGGFKHRYPQSFLDWMEKEFGIKWTKVDWKTVPKDKVGVHPLPPPTGKLYYCEPVYQPPTPTGSI